MPGSSRLSIPNGGETFVILAALNLNLLLSQGLCGTDIPPLEPFGAGLNISTPSSAGRVPGLSLCLCMANSDPRQFSESLFT
jgi:hypothetical protein